MVRFLLFLTCCSLLVGCEQNAPKSQTVLLTGQIVNPTNDAVILYKNDRVIDSAKLDKKNRFRFELDNIDEGLHHFNHEPEQQYIYLEKGDNVRIRLNTMAFDESLVFSGSNERVNNFMIEMFLNYEDEERLVYSYYDLSPTEFSHKIDSLRNQKLDELTNLVIGEDLSEKAYAMAKATVDYNSYSYKEKYPFYHRRKTSEDNLHQLDSAFYDYRRLLDFNNLELAFFKPYYDFMINHFGNLSYTTCSANCQKMIKKPAAKHLHFNRHKMALIDSLINTNELRDNLFRNVAMDYLLKVHHIDTQSEVFIKEFHGLSSNENHKQEIDELYQAIEHLQVDNVLPHILVENSKGENQTFKEISKNHNTVFYFWTASRKRHLRNVSKQLRKLKTKYPQYNYVGISLKTGKEQWKKLIDEYGLDAKNQYWGGDFDKIQRTLLIDGLNKCIISKDSVILDGFANIFQPFKEKPEKALVVN